VVTLSDDPLSARLAINARSAIDRNDQYTKNINTAEPVLQETDKSIQDVVSTLQRVRELTLQGGNGTNSQNDLNSIAQEVNQLLEHVVTLGNHLTNNRYIFGGTRSTARPFEVTRDANGEITAVNYVGNSDAIKVAVSDTVKVPINEPGSKVFQGTVDIPQLLINIRDDLRSGNTASLQTTRLDELDSSQDQLLSAISRVGSVDNRLQNISNTTGDFNVDLKKRLSEAVDADFAKVIVDLNAQSNAYQAALNATSRVIQPSLLDFIR